MKYTGSLVKKERERIFELFLDRHRLKFSDIEKALKLRSNMVSYHIEQMQKEGLLQKQGELYALTREGEKYIPLFSFVTGKELGPIPVILIAPVKGSRVILIKRAKRPYQGYWGFIGGKMTLEETVPQACERKLAESGIKGKFLSLNAIAQERVEEHGAIKHNFILFFVKASVQSAPGAQWFSTKTRERLIPSDAWLLKNKLSARTAMKSFVMQDKDGELSLREKL